MNDQGSAVNPYAPPKEDAVAPFPAHGYGRRSASPQDLRLALARLAEHVADPARMDLDRSTAGPQVRVVTWVFIGLAVVLLGMGFFGLAGAGSAASPLVPIGLGFGGFLTLMSVILLLMDMSLVPFGQPAEPQKVVKSFYKCLGMNRFGYAWSTLSPTAREQTVQTPSLGTIPTQPGAFAMTSDAGVKMYFSSFARPAKGSFRTMAVKKVTLRGNEGDVARVDVELEFQSWPQWISIATAVGFVIFRPLVFVGLILMLVLRQRHRVTTTKTVLRAPTGAWYVFDADVLEGAQGSAS